MALQSEKNAGSGDGTDHSDEQRFDQGLRKGGRRARRSRISIPNAT